jgi:hypothetical protein
LACRLERHKGLERFLRGAAKVLNMKEEWTENRRAPRNPCRLVEKILNMSTSLVTELERLAEALDVEGAGPVEIPLGAMAEKIAKSLGVQADEVAILGVSTRWRHLHFLVPQALKNVGFIPMSSTSALAARTARESRPEINNNFSAVRHATVFEGVKTPTSTGASIQKIISAPILCDGKVVGVMQISRKGGTPREAGADFTAEDLGKVLALCRPLGKLVRHLAGE